MCRVRPHRGGVPRVRPAVMVMGAIGAVGLAMAPGALSGCGRGSHPRHEALTFEELPDSATLSRGAPILGALEPYRLQGGAMRVRGSLRLPDGTRVQVTVSDARTHATLKTMQTLVQGGQFETPPFMTDRGPLPAGTYAFELLAYFNSTWQSDAVMRATGEGQSLRGPGIERARGGDLVFRRVEDRTL